MRRLQSDATTRARISEDMSLRLFHWYMSTPSRSRGMRSTRHEKSIFDVIRGADERVETAPVSYDCGVGLFRLPHPPLHFLKQIKAQHATTAYSTNTNPTPCSSVVSSYCKTHSTVFRARLCLLHVSSRIDNATEYWLLQATETIQWKTTG